MLYLVDIFCFNAASCVQIESCDEILISLMENLDADNKRSLQRKINLQLMIIFIITSYVSLFFPQLTD